MRDLDDLEQILRSIDGRGYGGFRRLSGGYRIGRCELFIDHVQADPYAPPSLVRVSLPAGRTGVPADLVEDRRGRVAVCDFLTRRLSRLIGDAGSRHDRRDGFVEIGRVGQEVLERTTVVITDDSVEARLAVGLPADGRRVRGRRAFTLLGEEIPELASAGLSLVDADLDGLREHVTLYRDQLSLRDRLPGLGLVALVGDGSILPRRSGDSDLPMTGGGVPRPVEFCSPASLRVTVGLPSGRTVTGMGVPEGVTVIVGGGYHGKSTLLRAIERGVHPHIAGDGREWVLTCADAVSVRAEDGRAVTGVDISPFIADLPSGVDTRRFSTTSASGSTSQAAGLVEAVDAGASALLIDEDTSATNFMIRDERMRRLIPADQEPITPFVDRVRPLKRERGVSTVLVAGGSGAFFDVADHVIAMEAYRPRDVTAQALEIAGRTDGMAPVADSDDGPVLVPSSPRVPDPRCLRPDRRGRGARTRGRDRIQLGDQEIDLSAVGQLVDSAQTTALARALDRLGERLDGTVDLAEAVSELDALIETEGLDVLASSNGRPRGNHPGVMARPRIAEIHAAVNRYRGLRLVRPAGGEAHPGAGRPE
ncbi:ATPase [Acidipropionibacterium jensenii]|uniref:ABC-ATPase domain-containing protein n=1 Tax=Acidipropionibacterium jensenii TaxID=1749 RepID=UPI00110BB519|nr:ABC-ATPase domain-containing protein [Acidipropionibacterium jensenii]QCV87205.1 ATPase [Acidipropionibacterium jensenii]